MPQYLLSSGDAGSSGPSIICRRRRMATIRYFIISLVFFALSFTFTLLRDRINGFFGTINWFREKFLNVRQKIGESLNFYTLSFATVLDSLK